ncbi:hypothetical protein GCM10010387_16010 [Streptomyces inusitatus]|uniref:Uncharacterized protein n=1 Tax=Streptomyces inusitatus TaxID=68221 RepID=A0A918UN30_9ACTN|nr:hypothetical protein [Streptomyces inusitatus]GGZ23612.1 hypothetical protein GCM10010387_16010 [Streptomyces inusitatus]
MSPAHLHAVPGPDEESGSGTWPVPTPAVVPSLDADADAPSAHAPSEAAEGAEREEAGEQARPRGFALPELRQYADPRPLAELGPLAVEVGKNASPHLLRGLRHLLRALSSLLTALWQMLCLCATGLTMLIVLGIQWLTGQIGSKGSIGARFAGTGFAVYWVAQLSQRSWITPWIVGGVALTLAALVASGQIELPESKSVKGAAKGEKGEKGKAPAKDKKDAPAKSKASAEGKKEATEEASKEGAPAPRGGLFARLRKRQEATGEEAGKKDDEKVDSALLEEVEEESGEQPEAEPEEQLEEEPEEAAASLSRQDLIRALHHLYQGGSGVLHTTLRAHLSLPDTRAVKGLLDEAGIPYRAGVRSPAGNGPGIHHHDFPPLPPAQDPPQGDVVVAGQAANTNTNNTANAPAEGGDPAAERWIAEDIAAGYRFIQDADRGPTAWKIQHYEGR